MALDSVVRARGMRYLMANVQRSSLDAVKKIIPGINGPTVIDILNGGDRVAVHAVVDADSFKHSVGVHYGVDSNPVAPVHNVDHRRALDAGNDLLDRLERLSLVVRH